MDLDRVVGGTDLFNLPDFIKIGLMSIFFILLVQLAEVWITNFNSKRGVSSNLTNSSNVINIEDIPSA